MIITTKILKQGRKEEEEKHWEGLQIYLSYKVLTFGGGSAGE